MNGCWFCRKATPPLYVCCEFDTFIHMECLKQAVATMQPDDRETAIIAEEFKDELLAYSAY